MNEGSKRRYFLDRTKKSFLYSVIAAAVMGVISIIYSLVKSSSILENMYLSWYYFGGLSLIFAVPQLYKRGEDSKLRRIRTTDLLRTNINPYEEQARLESHEEFKGEGFWSGMFFVLFSLLLFLYAFILENIYFMTRGA